MDASYKIQRGIHVHLIQFFMCPEFWVHIRELGRLLRFFVYLDDQSNDVYDQDPKLKQIGISDHFHHPPPM